ncbi:hypothetical protein EVAR_33940_1 [Eumeta japonica]|uniref:Uncharacterized protein n=1 Tax=Eumeta variegata TaxID=151549 RepID=A0A4C1VYL1_EUMVA|nr:hypothetical protein EVAR_33940_1 [Eumeta japonica]
MPLRSSSELCDARGLTNSRRRLLRPLTAKYPLHELPLSDLGESKMKSYRCGHSFRKPLCQINPTSSHNLNASCSYVDSASIHQLGHKTAMSKICVSEMLSHSRRITTSPIPNR